MVKAVIFDLDGTLIDSEPTYWAAWRDVFAPFGLSISDDEFRRHMGWKPLDVANDFLAMAGVTGDSEALVQQLVEAMIAHLPPALLPGATEALELTRGLGLSVALATGTAARLARATTDSLGFSSYFDAIISAEGEPYGKPHPAVFISAAEALGVAPEQCVVIEDAPNGVLAAKAAKMRCICVPDQTHRDDRVVAISDLILDSLTDLRSDHLT
jgi:mannitol-1-/sugar-/sorbitol-6-/2-deoxyglucose-6-phosphatase